MLFINKLKKFKKIYLIIITSVLFLNIFLISEIHAVSFTVSDIEISENFDLKFNKRKVFDKAFRAAFEQLTLMTTSSGYKKRLKKTSLKNIKSLIDSFTISDESFFNDKYFARFNVDFDKKKTLKFFEERNVFPSIPKKINILFLPVLINSKSGKLKIYEENPIFNNWNQYIESSDLINYILPNEDIEDRGLLEANINNIEDYNFEDIIKKYSIDNFIINIAYEEKNTFKVLSKIKFEDNYKIVNSNFQNIDLENKKLRKNFIYELKNIYEDSWKEINIINTSIKLPITISLPIKEMNKIKLFEDLIGSLDLVSDSYILSFNSEKIYYKIIYNGKPKKLLTVIENSGFEVVNDNRNWNIK
jgi:hypothetical protein